MVQLDVVGEDDAEGRRFLGRQENLILTRFLENKTLQHAVTLLLLLLLLQLFNQIIMNYVNW